MHLVWTTAKRARNHLGLRCNQMTRNITGTFGEAELTGQVLRHCLSVACRCLSLTFHCLSLTFSLPFLDLPLPCHCLFVTCCIFTAFP